MEDFKRRRRWGLETAKTEVGVLQDFCKYDHKRKEKRMYGFIKRSNSRKIYVDAANIHPEKREKLQDGTAVTFKVGKHPHTQKEQAFDMEVVSNKTNVSLLEEVAKIPGVELSTIPDRLKLKDKSIRKKLPVQEQLSLFLENLNQKDSLTSLQEEELMDIAKRMSFAKNALDILPMRLYEKYYEIRSLLPFEDYLTVLLTMFNKAENKDKNYLLIEINDKLLDYSKELKNNSRKDNLLLETWSRIPEEIIIKLTGALKYGPKEYILRTFILQYKSHNLSKEDIFKCFKLINSNEINENGLLRVAAYYIYIPGLFEIIYAYCSDNDKEGDQDYLTPLMIAVRHNIKRDIESIAYLIKHTQDINKSESHGMTALMYACELSDLEVIKLLLEAGAKTNIQDSNGKTALMYVLRRDTLHIDIIKLLIKYGADLNHKDNVGENLLIKSITFKPRLVKFLLDNNINIESKDKNGFSPLTHAILRENYEATKLLIEKGASPNSKDIEGFTPLIHLAQKSNGDRKGQETLNLLLKSGARVEIKDNSNRNILFHSSSEWFSSIMINNYEIDIDHKDNTGKTALYYFIKSYRCHLALFLLKNNAKINFLIDGDKPIDYIRKKYNSEPDTLGMYRVNPDNDTRESNSFKIWLGRLMEKLQ